MTIGEKLKKSRNDKGMSLRELATKVELSASFLSQIEQGKASPSIENLKKIAHTLDVRVAYLIEDEEDDIRNIEYIKKETLEKYGAVSEEVAREMLAGLKTDVGISTTGIAGPGGGTKDKPVGLVYIGIKVKNEVKVFKRELKGDRNKIRQRAMMHALYNLLKILSKKVR